MRNGRIIRDPKTFGKGWVRSILRERSNTCARVNDAAMQALGSYRAMDACSFWDWEPAWAQLCLGQNLDAA